MEWPLINTGCFIHGFLDLFNTEVRGISQIIMNTMTSRIIGKGSGKNKCMNIFMIYYIL